METDVGELQATASRNHGAKQVRGVGGKESRDQDVEHIQISLWEQQAKLMQDLQGATSYNGSCWNFSQCWDRRFKMSHCSAPASLSEEQHGQCSRGLTFS